MYILKPRYVEPRAVGHLQLRFYILFVMLHMISPNLNNIFSECNSLFADILLFSNSTLIIVFDFISIESFNIVEL